MPNKPITTQFLERQARMRIHKIWRDLTAGRRGTPAFIIIGAQKAGTTSLFKYLRLHPNVIPAHKKEVKFFDCNYSKGLDWYRSHFPYTGDIKDNEITGEASPHYIAHPLSPRRIAETLPQVKLIALLREPVARAYSHYQLNVRRKREELSFEEAIDQEAERTAGMLEKIKAGKNIPLYNFLHYSYLSKGLYADQLANWMEVFPFQQILILKSEDLFAHPEQVFLQVLAFLGLPAWEPGQYDRFNPGSYSEIRPEVHARLKEFFKPHNQRLYELLGRDFGWE